jgi:hypothetical protein
MPILAIRLGLVCIGSLDAETRLARGPRRELWDRESESYEGENYSIVKSAQRESATLAIHLGRRIINLC